MVPGEPCDDGGVAGGDGCSAACTVEQGWSCANEPSLCTTTCGDGFLAGAEECDDGGLAVDDGCSDQCEIEQGFICSGQPSDCGFPAFQVDGVLYGYTLGNPSPAAPTSGTFPLLRTGNTGSLADACFGLPGGSLSGAVALIRRGTCSFLTKSNNAQQAGAVAAIIYDNNGGQTFMDLGNGTSIPTVMISQASGQALNAELDMGPVTITWTGQNVDVY